MILEIKGKTNIFSVLPTSFFMVLLKTLWCWFCFIFFVCVFKGHLLLLPNFSTTDKLFPGTAEILTSMWSIVTSLVLTLPVKQFRSNHALDFALTGTKPFIYSGIYHIAEYVLGIRNGLVVLSSLIPSTPLCYPHRPRASPWEYFVPPLQGLTPSSGALW